MKAFFIRLAELLFVNCVLSVIVAGGFVSGILMSTSHITTLLVLCADAVFLTVQYVRSRALCFEAQDIRIYFTVSLAAFAVFAAVNFIFLEVLDPVPYTWLFITAKVLSIPTDYAVGNLWSALFFQALLLIVIFLAPLHRRLPDADDPELFAKENFKMQK